MATKRIGIIANPYKDGIREMVSYLVAAFEERGVEATVAQETARLCGLESAVPLQNLGEHTDLIVVLGGDGTMLHVVHAMGSSVKPLAAINMGRLGFLTCATSEERESFLELLVAEDYVLSRRSTIEVEVTQSSGERTILTGLNEAVIGRGNKHANDRPSGLHRRAICESLRRRWPHYRYADGIDRLFAFRRRTDCESGLQRLHHDADLFPRSLESLHSDS